MRRKTSLFPLLAAASISLVGSGLLAASPAPIQARSAALQQITGFLGQAPGLNSTGTLTVNSSGGAIIVSFSPGTTFVGGSNQPAWLDELATNDQLQVTGSFVGAVLQATQIADLSINSSQTLLVGLVQRVNAQSVEVLSQSDSRGRSPIAAGQTYVLPVSGSTLVTSGNTTVVGSTGPLNVGFSITALGTYDQGSNSFTATQRIHVTDSNVDQTFQIQGNLLNPPTNPRNPENILSVHLTSVSNPGHITPNLVTPNGSKVIVDGGTTYIRLLGEKSGLDELSAGDQLAIFGRLVNGTVIADKIQDLSLNGGLATLVGQVTGIQGSLVSVSWLQDPLGRSTLPGGAYVAPVGPSTKVSIDGSTQVGNLGQLALNDLVTVLGTITPGTFTFQSTDRITVTGHGKVTVSTEHHYLGYLRSLPGINGPTSLRLQVDEGTITITVPANVPVTRRNGTRSGLDELAIGDQLQITTQNSNNIRTATSIQDRSIQEGLTTLVGQVLGRRGPWLFVLAGVDPLGRSTLVPGRQYMVNVNFGTRVTVGNHTNIGNVSGIGTGSRVTVLGTINGGSNQIRRTSRIHLD